MEEKELIKYFKSLGLTVNTRTKARGHQGFFMKNRIDISKSTPPHRVVPTLLHEFAHYIHSKIEPASIKSCGHLEVIFKSDNPVIETELLKVTNFVDENSLCLRLYEHKERVKVKIKKYEKIVKKDYPGFQRSKKFTEFDSYIKKSKAKYLLKYDRVRVLGGLFNHKAEIFTIDNIEKDFPQMPAAFAAYIRLKSAQRKQLRISARINRYRKYYKKPSELFARLVEGLYLDKERACALAPYTTRRFYELLGEGYYKELLNIL
ncbi:MAG: hypothetical protein LBK53_05365 [Heliobacteriaceae bacterium]|jgi:hypothetical protein|nr:hypothetical protein [Heliobacteriaceae bacterium]